MVHQPEHQLLAPRFCRELQFAACVFVVSCVCAAAQLLKIARINIIASNSDISFSFFPFPITPNILDIINIHYKNITAIE